MSHMIDETTGKPAIAYVGEKPWHGLGAELAPGQDLETWRKAAGLDWSVSESPVMYRNGELRYWDERKVLFRSDTGAPLSVMGAAFHVVQPKDVLDLYAEIAKAEGFALETAGALSGGRRIWALAKVGEGADVVNRDRVRPYVLLATAFDGSMATTAKFTAVRVVCHNTLSMTIRQWNGEGATASSRVTERDETAPGREQVVRVLHSTEWNDDVAKDVRLKLGIVRDVFERFLVQSRALAARPMSEAEADDFVVFLLEPYVSGGKGGKQRDVRETNGYKRILELFRDQAIGSEMAGRTRWGMLNAVTQLIDHERGKSDATRLESAWFGTGNAIKERALRVLEGEFSRVAVEAEAAS